MSILLAELRISLRHIEHLRSEQGSQQREVPRRYQNGNEGNWNSRPQEGSFSTKDRPTHYATPDPLSNCFLSHQSKEIDTFPTIGTKRHTNEPTYPWKVVGQSKSVGSSFNHMDANTLRDQPFRHTSSYEEYSLEAKRGNDRTTITSHVSVGPGPLINSDYGEQRNISHQVKLSAPAKFLLYSQFSIGPSTASRESADYDNQLINTIISDTKKLEANAGGWNLFAESFDGLYPLVSSIESPQLPSAKLEVGAGNIWSERDICGDSEKKSSER